MTDFGTDVQQDRSKVAQGRTILIVDDTPANLRLLSHILTDQGYHVRPIPDGPLALAAVWADPPDLILLDVRMPEMDGYQVCERLKSDPQTRDIPVIFISALDATQDKLRAFRAGGVDYVTKPFQPAEVLARVETHLALRALQNGLQEANDTLKRQREAMAHELSLAGEVQASFLPQELPALPGWDLAATLLPAREASGDFYDLIRLPEGRLGLVMADVSDKGVAAALFMALSCTLLRTFAPQNPTEPGQVLTAVNRRILDDINSEQFVTVFYGVLEPSTGQLHYSNAGHPPGLLFRARPGGDVAQLGRTGIPLGILADWSWGRDSVQIEPGDLLVLYTDGITEAHGEGRELYGEERLLSAVQPFSGAAGISRPAPGEIQASILADVEQFAGRAPRSDDIALAILVRNSVAPG